MSDTDLQRALAFLERADHAAARVEETPLGRLFLTPELAKRWDSNYLLVRPDVDPDSLAERADPLFEAAGLKHRKLSVPDEALGAHLWTSLPREWMRQRLLVMAHRRAPDREPDLSLASEVDEARLRAPRAAMIATYPWGRDPEVQRQLLDAKLLAARSVETRFFAALVDHEPVSWADLYLADHVAQVEDVATLERYRNRGLASAVVMAAVRAAHEGGAELIFLVADDDDWPKELYVRLGFEAIGRIHDFVRPEPSGLSAEPPARP